MKEKIKLGDKYGGGVVFYLDNSNEHGLICSEHDLGECLWGLEGDINTSSDIFAGIENSKLILNQLSSQTYIFGITKKLETAARLCINLKLNGYNDWYLPSMIELKLIEENKNLLDGINRKTFYWSSSSAINHNNNLHNMAYFSKMGNNERNIEKLFLGKYMSQLSPFSDKCGRWLKLTVLPIRKF